MTNIKILILILSYLHQNITNILTAADEYIFINPFEVIIGIASRAYLRKIPISGVIFKKCKMNPEVIV